MTAGQRRRHVGATGQITHHHVHAADSPQRRGPLVIVVHEGADGHAVRTQLLDEHPANSPDTATGARYEDRMSTRHDQLPLLTANSVRFPA